jgi:hypothetical protein
VEGTSGREVFAAVFLEFQALALDERHEINLRFDPFELGVSNARHGVVERPSRGIALLTYE